MQQNPLGVGRPRRGLATLGPLATATAAVAEDLRAPHGESLDPAAFLARMMDLHGSVALARELDLLDRRPAQAPAPPDFLDVRAFTAERLDELAAAIDAMFADPFQRRNKLPDPDAVFSVLELGGALSSRSGRALASAAGQLWEPFGELASRALGRIRLETRSLREEIAPALRALGPDPARLERLDAALMSATQKGRERVLGELVPGLARCFSRGLCAAVAALPSPADAAHVAAWFAPEQWLRRETARMERVVRGVLEHEAGRLFALAEAAQAGA